MYVNLNLRNGFFIKNLFKKIFLNRNTKNFDFATKFDFFVTCVFMN